MNYTFIFASDIIMDHGADITGATVFAVIAFSDIVYFYDSLLLVAIFAIFFRLFQQSQYGSGTADQGILLAHLFISLVLGALSLAIPGPDCQREYLEVYAPGILYQHASNVRLPYVDILNITCYALYLTASLELFVGVLWFVMTRQGRNIRKGVSFLFSRSERI